MSTVKISDLAAFSKLNANTANTIFLGVDIPSGVTGKFTGTVLAQGLYSFNPLNVGNNSIILDNTISQFSGNNSGYLQVNLQNFSNTGSGDYVVTSDTGTNSTQYIDMGLNSSNFSDANYSAMNALDGYLYVMGSSSSSADGNLVIGTASSGSIISFISGGTKTENVIFKITKDGLRISSGKILTFGDGSTQNTSTSNVYSVINLANTQLKAYTDGAIVSANTQLKAYTDGLVSSSVVSANTQLKSYTDGELSVLESSLRANDSTTLDSAKSYMSQNYVANVSTINIVGNLVSPQNITANNFYVSSDIICTSTTTLKTTQGSNNNKNINIIAANDLAGFYGGSVNITSGSSTSLNGVAGNITLTPGKGYSSNGSVDVVGDLLITGGGTIKLTNSLISDNTQFLLVTAAANGAYQPPANPGYTVHTTSIDGNGNRIVADAFGSGANNYSAFIGRRGRGTAEYPTAIQSNDIIARFAGNGFGSTKFSQYGDARIEMVASENFTDISKRSRIDFYTTDSGSNTATVIATFNGSNATFSGIVNPQKGFVYTPNVISGNVTSLSIDIANNSLYRLSCNDNLNISLNNFQYGKVVELWLTNYSNSNRTVTHGCLAINSSTNSTTFTIPATSSAYIKYFSIDGDLSNTFVSVQHG